MTVTRRRNRLLAALALFTVLVLAACGSSSNNSYGSSSGNSALNTPGSSYDWTPIPPDNSTPVPNAPPTQEGIPVTFPTEGGIPVAFPTTSNESGGSTGSWLTVYFTDPNPPDNVGNGIDNDVVPVLENARQSIDVTSFDFNLPSVINALIDAKNRGVNVRMVLDEKSGTQTLQASVSPDHQTLDALQVLQNAGIPVVNGGRSQGLMHDKIIIVDNAILFMGSWNMSYNDTYRNNNNLLEITDPTLIANYEAKFNELFVNQQFGTHAAVGAQTPQLTIGGVLVENYFSPVDPVMDKLIAEVNSAKQSVKFMIFTYTDRDLANAMIAQAQAGVTVEGVIESRDSTQGALPLLYCAQIPVKQDGNPYTMHHKVIIIDDSTVITGSFNFTVSADKSNDDNVLIIHDPAVAALYDQEFAKIYGQGKDPDPGKITCP